ncbi:MAG: dTDP-4-dehydrorhamnose reductase [Chakrabartia sp.]
MIRALIVGRHGQVAHQLLAQAGSDMDVTALGRPELDLARANSVLEAARRLAPDIIINAAAYTAVDRAEAEPKACYAINRDGAAAAARAAAEIGVPFLHLSTDFIFDGAQAAPYGEEDAPHPLSVYGASKWAGEQAVRAAHPEAVIVRLCWVYSAWGHNFARTMLRLAAERQEIGVVADQWGRPTAAEDIAPALWHLARGMVAQPPPHYVYHLAASGMASWADFAQAIMAASHAAGGPSAEIRRITTRDYPTPARRPGSAILDCTRLERDWSLTLPDWRLSCARIVPQMLAGTD